MHGEYKETDTLSGTTYQELTLLSYMKILPGETSNSAWAQNICAEIPAFDMLLFDF